MNEDSRSEPNARVYCEPRSGRERSERSSVAPNVMHGAMASLYAIAAAPQHLAPPDAHTARYRQSMLEAMEAMCAPRRRGHRLLGPVQLRSDEDGSSARHLGAFAPLCEHIPTANPCRLSPTNTL